MKRLQNLGIMDDAKIDTEDIEYQDENEHMITIGNNPNKKSKELRIKGMLTKAMKTNGLLTKTFLKLS
jgi:hypothetical protein